MKRSSRFPVSAINDGMKVELITDEKFTDKLAPGQQGVQHTSVLQKHPLVYIVQLPPPVHGVSAMNKYVVNSPVINEQFTKHIVELRFSKNNDQLEKASFAKAILLLTHGVKIAKTMIRARPKLVYFTLMPTGFGFYRDALYVFLLKFFSTKIVLHLHGKGIRKNASNRRWKRVLYKIVFKNTHVISLSKTLAFDIADIYKDKPYIVSNGIELQSSLLNEEVNKDAREVPQLLFLSNYIENKGVLVLMRALAILKDKGYRFHTRFVGAPAHFSVEKLNDISQQYGLSDFVEIVGPRYGEQKYEEFRRADIFVFPTYNDAFPLVNLEAMQFSLPIVSTDEGGIPDIVENNETGFLVERQNPEMLAEKIALLLENEELLKEMGRKGYERFINNFTLQHFERNLKNTLSKILTASGN